MIQYGSKTVIETKYRGSHTDTITTYKESVMVENDQQLLAEILKHLEFCKQGNRIDPVIEMDTDRTTGRIKRIVKSWTESN